MDGKAAGCVANALAFRHRSDAAVGFMAAALRSTVTSSEPSPTP